MKKPGHEVGLSSAGDEKMTEHDFSSINSVSEFNITANTNKPSFHKASTFKHNDFEDIEDESNND